MQSLVELKIIINKLTPGSERYNHYADSWENNCHSKSDFIWIHYSNHRATSRWQSVPRARPFLVEYVSSKNIGWNRLGSYKTLDAAILAATKYVKRV